MADSRLRNWNFTSKITGKHDLFNATKVSNFSNRKLLEFVFHYDVATTSAAGLALKHSLQTSEATNALMESTDVELKNLLRPFVGPLTTATYDRFTLTTEASYAESFDVNKFSR